MAHVFSNEDGSIGTVILVSARNAEQFVPENATYHGDLEIPEHDYPASLRHKAGVIYEDAGEVKVIKIAEAHERHDSLRLEIRDELHEAHLEGLELEDIRAKAVDLAGHRDAVIDEISNKRTLNTIKAVNHLEFDHSGNGLGD